MNKKYALLAVCSCLLIGFFFTYKKIEPVVDFFNTSFLRDVQAVEKVLKEEGFFEADITTNDKLTIFGIMRDQSSTRNVQATIISCPGFVPGRKEGMTTLYVMLKKNPFNFLFLDLRGHGKSQGELLTYSGIKNYGKFEYLDIVATVQFVTKYNKEHNLAPDIIIHGLCSGAFHTIKAMDYLKTHDIKTYHNVKGIVFDSGWPSVADIVESTITSESNKRCKDCNLSFLQSALSCFMVNFYRLFFKDHHLTQKSILSTISKIDQPILFIHAENDTYIPIHHVYPLIKTSKNPKTWLIKESTHALHHLKYKEEYTLQLEQFIKSVL